VRWTARDAAGNTTNLDQTVSVTGCFMSRMNFTTRDRSRLTTASGGAGQAVNYGNGTAQVGVESRTGMVTSVGPVSVATRARIDGSVVTSSTASVQSGAIITGGIRQGETLSLPAFPAITNTWPSSSSGDVRLEPSQTRSIAPGSFGTISVKQNAVLTLAAGTYYVDRLELESQGAIRTSGNVTLEVRSGLIHRGAYRDAASALATVTIRYRGTTTAYLESAFNGHVLAPTANLVLGSNVPTAFKGTFFASAIEVRADATITLGTPAQIGGAALQSRVAADAGKQDETSASCAVRPLARRAGASGAIWAAAVAMLSAALRRRRRQAA
jgi:hypothetical protein